ncbi:MAG: D-alanine--D-alanine ligase [Lentisphaerae bacterium]|nr:D-alanine--D-alanine ligase [Lentisphaerota bacterium]
MGGPSSEREVSLRSGAAITRGLCEAGYDAVAVEIAGRSFELPGGTEAVFIALHGEFGEDGEVQAILDGMSVPYTGSGSDASRRAMDKIVSKELFVAAGIPTPEHIIVRGDGALPMKPPLVVKPPRQGSSIGCTRVFAESDWERALGEARAYDEEVLVERFIPGREITVGIVGEEALPAIEIVAPDDNYDYSAKYTRGGSRHLCPAPLDPDAAALCARTALDSSRALGCRGMGRVDIRLSENGTPYVLEMNTIPGFTETSLLPEAAASAGIGFGDLCERILELAVFGA